MSGFTVILKINSGTEVLNIDHEEFLNSLQSVLRQQSTRISLEFVNFEEELNSLTGHLAAMGFDEFRSGVIANETITLAISEKIRKDSIERKKATIDSNRD